LFVFAIKVQDLQGALAGALEDFATVFAGGGGVGSKGA